jgi:LAO/AO transport system kinase
VREQLPQLTAAVQAGQLAASTAARNLLSALEFTAQTAPK